MGLVLLMGVLLWVAAPSFDSLVYHRERMIELGQWWRVWSGHLVHWTPYHFGLNALGLVVWVLLCPRRWNVAQWMLTLAWLGGGVSLWLLLVQPDMIRYAGFSGILHGLFLLGLVPQAARRDRIAGLCLLYLVVKIIWEQALGVPLSDAERIGAAVATDAHLAGVVAAVMLLIGGHYKRKGLAMRRE